MEISDSNGSLNRLMKSIFGVVVLLALAFTGSSSIARRDNLYRFNYENVLGTSLELTFSATSEVQAHEAEAAALGEIDRESKILELVGQQQRV